MIGAGQSSFCILGCGPKAADLVVEIGVGKNNCGVQDNGFIAGDPIRMKGRSNKEVAEQTFLHLTS